MVYLLDSSKLSRHTSKVFSEATPSGTVTAMVWTLTDKWYLAGSFGDALGSWKYKKRGAILERVRFTVHMCVCVGRGVAYILEEEIPWLLALAGGFS